jgi:RNA polymerase primary sigma factor
MICTHPSPTGTTRSPLETYLRQIDETALLTAEQEKKLAHRIEEGDCEARDHLVRANLRLVVKIARVYQGKGVELHDLIAEGNLGLLRAAEAFDVAMETRFSTYAVYWIKQSIRRALSNTSRTIRLPAYMSQLVAEWQRTTARLNDEQGCPPTEAEVASRLKLTPRKLRLVRKAVRIHNAAPQEEANDSRPFDDLGADGRAHAPDAELMRADESQQVLRLVDELEHREKIVLQLRFGLAGEDLKTLKEIGVRLDLTRERVRQIEREALNKLHEMLLGA